LGTIRQQTGWLGLLSIYVITHGKVATKDKKVVPRTVTKGKDYRWKPRYGTENASECAEMEVRK